NVASGTEHWQVGESRRTLLVASLMTTSGEISVKIRELSVTQAMLTGVGLPRSGTDVILKRRNFNVFAMICSSDGSRCEL
ncbi:hypothetical protein, partial [Sphingomonas sp.]|uniref:hypothetical protein n=1 Tax=Sphingomonas sp. TaxID=28214 RepID=UPI0025F04813